MSSKKNTPWSRLDNAAKIFPPTSGKRDPKVFRFACELNDPVRPQPLQQALDRVLELFPGYRSVLRHGLFWYYLEQSERNPLVREEDRPPCAPIYDREANTLLFEVTYYGRRINLEVYHALSDGTGAQEFLKALVCRYLALVHPELENAPLPDSDSSVSEKMADSFQKYYDPKNRRSDRPVLAYKLRGPRLPENRIKTVEGIMPVKRVLALAREKGTTVTVLFTSLLLCAIHDGMSRRDKRKPVVVSVPVNLRKYFVSASARNFFAMMTVAYDFPRRSSELDEVIPAVAEMFRKNLAPDRLEQHMNSLVAIEKNLAARAVPLFLKDLCMRAAYRFSSLGETAAISNVGQVWLPEEYAPYIRLFDVLTSTDKVQICMCSYRENMVVNFCDPFLGTEIPKYFFRALVGFGIPIEIVTNPVGKKETGR